MRRYGSMQHVAARSAIVSTPSHAIWTELTAVVPCFFCSFEIRANALCASTVMRTILCFIYV